MSLRRLGRAALLVVVTTSPAAATRSEVSLEPEGEARSAELARLPDLLRSLGKGTGTVVGVVQTRTGRQGPALSQPGNWAHAEVAVVIGSQLVNQDLGFSTNIFQTVTAEADDVGFGQHYGARGSFFVNRYLGAEAGFARTTTEFEFSVIDEEAGVTIFEEPLVQVSQEATVSVVAQWPRAAVTPYAVIGYAWRTSEVEGGEPFESGAVVLGFGIKVPFPEVPVSLAFDYRHIEYGDEGGDALRLAEGRMSAPTVSALTLGVVVRLNVNR